MQPRQNLTTSKGDDTFTKNVQRFRGGLVFKARRICVSLNSRRESNKEEEDRTIQSHQKLTMSSSET